jgi:hypothetical protein
MPRFIIGARKIDDGCTVAITNGASDHFISSPRCCVTRNWRPSSACAAVAPKQTNVNSFAGCYELKFGRWWPWSFGGDNEFVTPPAKIQLLPVKGTNGFEEYGFVIHPIPPSKSIHRFSYWQITSDNHAELEWTTGFSGITLSLDRHGEELRGWAHPHWDFPTFIPHIMHVTAQPIACEIPQ